MRYAVIEDGVITNIVVATPEFAAAQGWIECPDEVNIGWSYDGTILVPPPRDLNVEWTKVRERRDNLLIESDTYVLPDRWMAMTVEQQQAWATYRQALRDIPQEFTDPAQVVWPEKPE